MGDLIGLYPQSSGEYVHRFRGEQQEAEAYTDSTVLGVRCLGPSLAYSEALRLPEPQSPPL